MICDMFFNFSERNVIRTMTKKIKEGLHPLKAYTKLTVAAGYSGMPRFVVTVAVFTKSAGLGNMPFSEVAKST